MRGFELSYLYFRQMWKELIFAKPAGDLIWAKSVIMRPISNPLTIIFLRFQIEVLIFGEKLLWQETGDFDRDLAL